MSSDENSTEPSNLQKENLVPLIPDIKSGPVPDTLDSKNSLKSEKYRIFSNPIVLLGIIFGILIFAKLLLIYILMFMNAHSWTGILLNSLGYQWDSIHFINIAENGYPKGVSNDILYAFAPFYPIMIKLVNYFFNNYLLSGIVVSNICYFLSIIAFFKVAFLYTDIKDSAWLTLLFGLFPIYLVYGTIAYSEAPYLLFAISSWYFFKKENYILCSVFSTFAILTRYIGGFLLPLYVIIAFWKKYKSWKRNDPLKNLIEFPCTYGLLFPH